MAAITLDDILNLASANLGETTRPTSQDTVRMYFANNIKTNIRNLRNWTWELKSGTPINTVLGTATYPLADDLKNTKAVKWVSLTDSAGNVVYYSSVDEPTFQQYVANSIVDPIYYVSGNTIDGWTIHLSPSPTESVTNGLNYEYYWSEPDFTANADETRIPTNEVVAWGIVAQVALGYREQSFYQLATNEMNESIADLSMQDQKRAINDNTSISTLRQAKGRSNNFRTYY